MGAHFRLESVPIFRRNGCPLSLGICTSLSGEQIAAIESVSMDMWPAFINATLESIPGAEEKIAFDKFHVAKYLGEAVDKVRREEHKALMAEGRDDLKGSKYTWQYNPKGSSPDRVGNEA
uniref:Transposase n=2 Tax=Candidatus Kentrum sp. UNK TaxID=2126344 RepID=A0A451AUQ5_9GAMM|nr:MAG: Transposase [Candidatus Kentron sp. UNK]